jgi:hypothetical protein
MQSFKIRKDLDNKYGMLNYCHPNLNSLAAATGREVKPLIEAFEKKETDWEITDLLELKIEGDDKEITISQNYLQWLPVTISLVALKKLLKDIEDIEDMKTLKPNEILIMRNENKYYIKSIFGNSIVALKENDFYKISISWMPFAVCAFAKFLEFNQGKENHHDIMSWLNSAEIYKEINILKLLKSQSFLHISYSTQRESFFYTISIKDLIKILAVWKSLVDKKSEEIIFIEQLDEFIFIIDPSEEIRIPREQLRGLPSPKRT